MFTFMLVTLGIIYFCIGFLNKDTNTKIEFFYFSLSALNILIGIKLLEAIQNLKGAL